MATVDIRGQVVIFDDSDRPLFDAHKWWVTDRGYVLTKIRGEDGKRRSIGLHRLLLGDPKEDIDHIDRNPRNNTRGNLRACGRAANNKNVPTRKNKTSGHRGVSWNKRKNAWQVVVREGGRLKWKGYYESEDQAARVAAPYFAGIAP
jgi:hypothetical protein